MSDSLRLLLLEDSLEDTELNERVLRKAGIGFDSLRVDRREDFASALETFTPDLILADYNLSGFDGMQALDIAHERCPATPFIFVSGAMGEELAVESIKRGATDYILKDRLARLPAAVLRALDERKVQIERALAQQALSASEERYHQLVENMGSGVAIFRQTADGTGFIIQSVNRSVERIECLPREALIGRSIEEVFPGAASMGMLDALQRVSRTGEAERLPPARYRDARISGWRENFIYRLGTGELVAVYEDVSERFEREAQIHRLNRTLRTISACNQDLVRARCEVDLLESVCRDLVEIGQYRLAWVDYPQEGCAATRDAAAHWGDASAYRRRCEWDRVPSPDAEPLTRSALRQCKTLSSDPIAAVDSGAAPAQSAAIGFLLALPLLDGNAPLGVLAVLSGTTDAFDAAEVNLLEELACDLTYGIVSLRTAAERNQYSERLRQAMRGTVSVLARTVEMRDPYTAGHQQRVAALAVAVARAMGLPETLVEGLYFGAMIHDVGKISVPAELLNKPTRLTPIEFQLIQQHAETGYLILADIDFPWPLAEMVRQHHERIDGSGYPRGLPACELLQESRILAVADVVEAMSSNRPYRVALGVEAALAEIAQGKGTRYDPEVVTACEQVIRANGMAMPQQDERDFACT